MAEEDDVYLALSFSFSISTVKVLLLYKDRLLSSLFSQAGTFLLNAKITCQSQDMTFSSSLERKSR